MCLYLAATFIALRSIVLVEILGIQKLTNAFGITVLFQGFAVLMGSPISGFFPLSVNMICLLTQPISLVLA